MATLTVMDPVTRVEGHLKVEITIESSRGVQQVVDARCTGTLFRGFETILAGRDPRDATVLTPRICGVCPVSHGLASSMALEKAARVRVPGNGRLLRNLLLGSNYLQSHILHFYLLAILDYVRGPQTAPWAPAWEVDLREDSRLSAIAGHLVQAVEARRRAHEMGAVFGGRMPLAHANIPGGITAPPTEERIARFRDHLRFLLDFVENVYVPDVEALAEVYEDYRSIGTGCGNLLTYGVFEIPDAGKTRLFRPGVVEGASSVVQPVPLGSLSEQVAYSWYDDSTDRLNPVNGKTQPLYPKGDAYSWLKAPRLRDKPFEVGPLARMWVNGDYRQGISVMDRHLARAYEALKVARAMEEWLDRLKVGKPVYSDYQDPKDLAFGMGLTEAPRGALGHWVWIVSGKIQGYQIVTPTCWNASPRDSAGVPGPMEQALIGTPVEDPSRPVEALRVVHSFDPCLSCAVHVLRPGRGEGVEPWEPMPEMSLG